MIWSQTKFSINIWKVKHGNSLIDFLLNLQVHTEILGISRLCAKYASTPIKEAVNQFRHSFDRAGNRVKGEKVKKEAEKRGSGDDKIPIELISSVGYITLDLRLTILFTRHWIPKPQSNESNVLSIGHLFHNTFKSNIIMLIS